MHEMGYTKDVVNTVVQAAEMARANEVRCVYLDIGEIRDIVDDLFCKCFTYLARGTVAENSQVSINRIPLALKCRCCGEEFHADVYSGAVRCPSCGKQDYEVLRGMEFCIDHIEVA